jgi:hypothetical protein
METAAMRNKSHRIALSAVIGLIAGMGVSAVSHAQTPQLGQPCNMMQDLASINPPVLTPVDATTKEAILKSGLPCQENVNIVGPGDETVLENLQRGFDFYSWLTFIALNSPANGTEIANSRSDMKTKWEDTQHFIQLLDVMLRNGSEPKWDVRDKTQTIPEACRSLYTPEGLVIEMIEETFNQPFKTGPLIDQRRNYALFDILMNKSMFDYVVKHRLYNKAAQMSAETSKLKIDFPAGANPGVIPEQPNGGPGGIIVKVSWKILDPEDDRSKFHTADALVIMPRHDQQSPAHCLRKTLGLVGFHVMHKTKSRAQWIWTSFEHVDNVPEQKDVDAGRLKRSYNFYDPLCDKAKCPVNETPPRPWDPDPALKLKFHSSFYSQITRVVPLTDATKEMNAKFQAILDGTVWKNYMLLSTQWPSDRPCTRQFSTDPQDQEPKTDFLKEPDMTCAPAPTFLANSTLETYSQGEVPLASSSCMGCHGNAVSYQPLPNNAKPAQRVFNQSDFTFILEKAGRR